MLFERIYKLLRCSSLCNFSWYGLESRFFLSLRGILLLHPWIVKFGRRRPLISWSSFQILLNLHFEWICAHLLRNIPLWLLHFLFLYWLIFLHPRVVNLSSSLCSKSFGCVKLFRNGFQVRLFVTSLLKHGFEVVNGVGLVCFCHFISSYYLIIRNITL